MTANDEIQLYALTEVRVCTSRHLPGKAVLAMTSGGETTHYAMTVDELAALAVRLTQDAKLLKA